MNISDQEAFRKHIMHYEEKQLMGQEEMKKLAQEKQKQEVGEDVAVAAQRN